jgi:hypothetical protein
MRPRDETLHVFHNFAHQGFDYLLANRTILAARQICHCFCNRRNYFISVDRVWLPRHRRIIAEKILDQFDHHAVEARALFGVLGFWHGRSPYNRLLELTLVDFSKGLSGAEAEELERLRKAYPPDPNDPLRNAFQAWE